MWGAIAGAGASLIGGSIDRRSAKKQAAKERRNAIQDQRLSLSRLRESAELADFNPLTALMAGGAGTFGMGLPSGSAAPLASQSVLQNAVRDVADYLKPSDPDDDVRREMNKTNLELAKLKLEKAQAGNAGEVVARTATLGRRPLPGASTSSSEGGLYGPTGVSNWLFPEREIEAAKLESHPGGLIMNNKLTGGNIYLPGNDGDVDDLGQLIVKAGAFLSQAPGNWSRLGYEKMNESTKKKPVKQRGIGQIGPNPRKRKN